MKNKTILTTLFILASLGLSAQNYTDGETFQLSKKDAHYMFTTSVNGTADATFLVESGIPADTNSNDGDATSFYGINAAVYA